MFYDLRLASVMLPAACSSYTLYGGFHVAADQVNVRLAQVIDIPALVSLMHTLYGSGFAPTATVAVAFEPAHNRLWAAYGSR